MRMTAQVDAVITFQELTELNRVGPVRHLFDIDDILWEKKEGRIEVYELPEIDIKSFKSPSVRFYNLMIPLSDYEEFVKRLAAFLSPKLEESVAY